MMIRLNEPGVEERLSHYLIRPLYGIDETDEVFDDLDEAKQYGERFSSGWVGEMHICQYFTNVCSDPKENKYKLIDPLNAPLKFTGNYWTLTNDGWVARFSVEPENY